MSHSDSSEEQSQIQIRLHPATVARFLLAIVTLLVITGGLANYVIYNVAPDPEHKLARLMRRFDLGHEPSLPALYSSLALMACAVLLALAGLARKRQNAAYSLHWLALSAIFVLLSIDECVMIHEMVDNVVAQYIERSGLFYFVWVIPGAAFVAFVGLAYLGFLWHLAARTRWLFIASGALFVFGAIGMEMVAGVIAETAGLESIQHTLSQTVEEACEMLGIVLFIYALLDYIDREFGGVRIQTRAVASSMRTMAAGESQ